ncbi:MAG: hypothetical protein ACREMS_01340 [Gemmatimonadaceae bacterium]
MSTLRKMTAVTGALVAIACHSREPKEPSAEELATVSPEAFSHTDAGYADDEKCGATDGVVISPQSIGPVRLGRTLRDLRDRCKIAMVKVPGSIAVQGPVLAVSLSGGLILFTVAGKDSAIQTAGTSSPAFRTASGIGVGTSGARLPSRLGSVCFRRDSLRIMEVLLSRRPMRC